MQKIDFINNQQPALNATNLNKLQQNVEDDIGDLTELETSAKNNLVEAINEAASTGSGGDTLPIYSIVDYDGDTVPTGYEEVNSYSTSEVKTGDTWIDGKPIYRKVVTGSLSDGTIAHGLSNITFVNSYGHFISGSGAFMPLASLRIGAPDYSCGYYINATNVVFDKAGSASGTAYVVLEYTKTTD